MNASSFKTSRNDYKIYENKQENQTLDILIIGAGVIGITIACALLSKGHRVKIVTRDLPFEERSEQCASPWAGAIWYPFEDEWNETCKQSYFEKQTFEVMQRMKGDTNVKLDYLSQRFQDNLPIFSDDILAYSRTRRVLDQDRISETLKIPWWKDVVVNFCEIDERVQDFTTFSLQPTEYLKRLLDHYKCDRLTFHRGTASSLARAKEQFLPNADLIINASGLGARYLADVNDKLVMPIRGQTIVIKKQSALEVNQGDDQIQSLFVEGTRDGHDMIYVISRADSDEILLGGSAEPDSFSTLPDKDQIQRIIQGTKQYSHHLCADLQKSITDPSIIHTGVGLRPGRKGGPRLDWQEEKKDINGKQILPPVIHAYGSGKTGFQVSWGVAIEVMRMVEEHTMVS
ncbi:nucleotide-binding domain-containing protein [Meira miltonrushii]|uniref:Nucleotide-binding domain-containing protein n=1 Tax=Meira miltonrushii TaxID=1280837 RepID=A0A316VEZ9_9BASI|nr:nucleotide-binding domain-containing protein [Meira miltonrushii]PWN36110.1 nucleotide-binding domain-containing protein [Meira miltonrushii]